MQYGGYTFEGVQAEIGSEEFVADHSAGLRSGAGVGHVRIALFFRRYSIQFNPLRVNSIQFGADCQSLTGCDPLPAVVLDEDPGARRKRKGTGRLAIRRIEFRKVGEFLVKVDLLQHSAFKFNKLFIIIHSHFIQSL